MRISVMVISCFIVTHLHGQYKKSDKVNVSFENQSLETILDNLSSQTAFFFSYNSDVLPKGSLYTITATNEPLDEFLSKLLVGTGLQYTFFKDQIILNRIPPKQEIKKKKLFTVSGVVYDENRDPLYGVNVFLDGTTIGVSSDLAGRFELKGIPAGLYNIVFSHVGYENAVYQLSETNGGERIQNHQMAVKVGALEEVAVVGDRIDKSEGNWQSYYNTFKKELIGQSKNAEQCVIENPESLNFTYKENSDMLKAYTQLPIKIRNDALGYRISYFLESFEKEKESLRFRGKIRFSNLQPISEREKRAWRKNRKKSYLGSFNHFKQALLNKELKKEGFYIYQVKNLQNLDKGKENMLSESDIVIFKGNYYELEFKNYLLIEYRGEKESLDFLENSKSTSILYPDQVNADGVLMKNPENQISIIRLLKGPIRLDFSGEIIDRFGITSYGYWSWERTAELVPINYDQKYDEL